MPSIILSLLGAGKSAAGALFAWLSRRSLAELAVILLALICAFQFVALKAEKRHSAKVEAQLGKCTSARHADQQAYAAAQADAQAKNKAQVARIEQQYQRNSDDERQAYLDDLARLRAERVRLQGTAAAQGSAGAAGAPADRGPAQGADADGLPLSADEHLQASEIELRLMHLQNWVEKQLSIDPNK